MTVFGSATPLMSRASSRFTVPTIGLAVCHSVCGPSGSSMVGGVFTSAGAANACWTAALAARVTSGTVIPSGTASIMLCVISKYPPPELRAIACSEGTDATGGAMAMT